MLNNCFTVKKPLAGVKNRFTVKQYSKTQPITVNWGFFAGAWEQETGNREP